MSWDKIVKLAEFVASFATVGAIVVAYLAYRADRRDRVESRKNLKATTFTALHIEVDTVHGATEKTIENFNKTQYSSPNPEQDQRYFVWTLLPSSTIEQALREAFLLELNRDQIEALQDLRLQILYANQLVNAKIGTLPSVASNLAEGLVRHLNTEMYNRMGRIEQASSAILKWLPDERKPAQAKHYPVP